MLNNIFSAVGYFCFFLLVLFIYVYIFYTLKIESFFDIRSYSLAFIVFVAFFYVVKLFKYLKLKYQANKLFVKLKNLSLYNKAIFFNVLTNYEHNIVAFINSVSLHVDELCSLGFIKNYNNQNSNNANILVGLSSISLCMIKKKEFNQYVKSFSSY